MGPVHTPLKRMRSTMGTIRFGDLDEVGEAHRASMTRHRRGKLVVVP